MAYHYHAGDPPVWIPKDQLVEGMLYEGQCRNAEVARWVNGEFEYLRTKFGHQFIEHIPCPEDGMGTDVFFAFNQAQE